LLVIIACHLSNFLELVEEQRPSSTLKTEILIDKKCPF